MRDDRPALSDATSAAILSAGLRLGVVDPAGVIAWADSQIARRPDPPPPWLIDLSLSRDWHIADVISLLNTIAGDTDGKATFLGVCSLLPNITHYTFEQCKSLAAKLYQTAYFCLSGDWSDGLLAQADEAADMFEWYLDGELDMAREEILHRFHQFVASLRDKAVAQHLQPIRFLIPT